jgi:hypothetical protein
MWKKHREFIDAETGAHVQVLKNAETGVEHVTQIMLAHHSCPACGTAHVVPEAPEDIDPKAKLAADMEMLNTSHAAVKSYAAKHGVPVRGLK